MNRLIVVLAFLLPGVAAFGADPSASVTSVAFDGRQFVVKYSLSGEPAVVTAAFDVGGQTVEAVHVAGDVNKVVATGAHTLCWRPDKDCGNVSADVTPRLSVWATNAPPPYMVVDLPTGNVRYYASTNALPDGGLASDIYRTDKMVLRRIPSAGVTWWMGSPEDESGRTAAIESRHKVKFTRDYYLGVYEVTQRQAALIKTSGNHENYFTNSVCAFTRPAEGVAWNWLRGTGSTDGCKWPESAAVSDVSWFGQLRARTGLDGFDLPTEAEWEYAARAGTAEARYDMGDVSLIARTAAANPARDIDLSGGTARVGSYAPNAWGLYDMLGNVWEWVLDYRIANRNYDTSVDVAEDPRGEAPATYGEADRFRRGGAYDSANLTQDFRAARRSYAYSQNGYQTTYFGVFGFRVAYHH